MDLVLRLLEPGELRAVGDVFAPAFGQDDFSEERRQQLGHFYELDRTFGVFEGDQMVGTSGALSLQVTVPGGGVAPMAGVTMVAVLPTHRRRRILRRMMTALLDQAMERQEPLAGLTASEASIYGRFGFGAAAYTMQAEIATPHGALRMPDDPGRVRLVGGDEARTLLPPVFDRSRRQRPGQIGRSDHWWDTFCADPSWAHEGGGQLRVLVHEGHDGGCDGYLAYRRKEVWRRFVAAGTLHVVEAYADHPLSYLALWRVALESDLVATVSTWQLPVDDPLRHALVDARRLSVAAVHDGLWLRLLDVERALTARAYGVEGDLVLEVVDPFRPRNDGCYHLEVGPDGSACARTDAPPHLGLDVADLGSLFLGGVSATALAGAGRIHAFRPGAVATADRVFANAPAPFLGTEF